MLNTVIWLVVAHFALDYPLQGDSVAKQKSPDLHNALSEAVPWYYWMTAHALCHAGAVYAITRSPVMFAVELVTHFALDYAKCKDWISIHTDQAGHLLMKAGYVAYLM